MNQKGIVISSLVYALLTFFLLLLAGLLTILWYRQNAINNLGTDANNIYNNTYTPEVLLTTRFPLDVGTEGTYESKGDSHYFVGANPNNWVAFGMVSSTNNTPILWRVIKNGPEGIKIIYEGPQNAGETPPTPNGKITLTNNYWDSVSSNKWNRPAYLNTALATWYNNLYVYLKSNYIQPINWCVGGIGLVDSVSDFPSYECISRALSSGKYDGFTTNQTAIGLINPSDYVNASAAASCTTYDQTICGTGGNYLYKSAYSYWTMNAFSDNSSDIWTIDSSGAFNQIVATNTATNIRPVINLGPDVVWASGNGSLSNPYKMR
ncbi:MAG: hypothetical protein PHS98_05210 [Bacilli bacterium]|nr:hypothetical protein [Bacilli bacterium]